jgi:glycine betaine/proline transport system permease protein
MPVSQIVFSALFLGLVVLAATVHYSFPGQYPILTAFPTIPEIRLTAIIYVEGFFNWAVVSGDALFSSITFVISTVLDTLELVFVSTPWIVIASLIILLTWLTAGVRMAIWSGAFLAYMGLLGFWEKAMTTLALLGTAACLSILIGIPLGMFAARRLRFYAFIRPIMDFMQTMPAFVYLIPVIAFFGTGKPPGIIATLIFGMPPVIRLTTLGLTGVAEDVKEAARAYGATEWQVLRGVELPLAKASILAGINQTILMCLSMVVIASLIGAQGLGSVVLTSLQYAAKGQGLLAGLAILLCAMVIDRIVQGSFRKRE